MKTFKNEFLGRSLLVLAFGLAVLRAGAQVPPQSVAVANQVVTNGGTAVFNVTVVGAGPFSYQWYYDGTPVSVSNIITTVAGQNSLIWSYSGDGGAATNAGLYYPNDIALDGVGNLYIADTYNNVIRLVAASGVITTVAGNHALGGELFRGRGRGHGGGVVLSERGGGGWVRQPVHC